MFFSAELFKKSEYGHKDKALFSARFHLVIVSTFYQGVMKVILKQVWIG